MQDKLTAVYKIMFAFSHIFKFRDKLSLKGQMLHSFNKTEKRKNLLCDDINF